MPKTFLFDSFLLDIQIFKKLIFFLFDRIGWLVGFYVMSTHVGLFYAKDVFV